MRKSEFRVAGATQDATSAERCDLTQDPSSCRQIHLGRQAAWPCSSINLSSSDMSWLTSSDTEETWLCAFRKRKLNLKTRPKNCMGSSNH